MPRKVSTRRNRQPYYRYGNYPCLLIGENGYFISEFLGGGGLNEIG